VQITELKKEDSPRLEDSFREEIGEYIWAISFSLVLFDFIQNDLNEIVHGDHLSCADSEYVIKHELLECSEHGFILSNLLVLGTQGHCVYYGVGKLSLMVERKPL